MYYFQIFSDLKILNPPEWFDEFVEQYYVPVIPHITFTQSRFVQKELALDIIEKIQHEAFASVVFPLTVNANNLRYDEDENGVAVLLDFYHAELSVLQKQILQLLPKELELVYPKRKEYEDNFQPHITIATRIPPSQQKEIFGKFKLYSLSLVLKVEAPFAFLSNSLTTESVNDSKNHYALIV